MQTRSSFWRAAVLAIAACVLSFTVPVHAAGTLTVTVSDAGNGVTLYTLTWTATAGGAVSANAFPVKKGYLLHLKCYPASGGDQPTDLYDITLLDEQSIDLLSGRGANLSNSTGSYLQWDPPVFHEDTQDLDLVVANAGNAKKGTCLLLVQ